MLNHRATSCTLKSLVSSNCASFELEEIVEYFIPASRTAIDEPPPPACDSFHAFLIDFLCSGVRRGASVESMPNTLMPLLKYSLADLSAYAFNLTVLSANDNNERPLMPLFECNTTCMMFIGSTNLLLIRGT